MFKNIKIKITKLRSLQSIEPYVKQTNHRSDYFFEEKKCETIKIKGK